MEIGYLERVVYLDNSVTEYRIGDFPFRPGLRVKVSANDTGVIVLFFIDGERTGGRGLLEGFFPFTQ